MKNMEKKWRRMAIVGIILNILFFLVFIRNYVIVTLYNYGEVMIPVIIIWVLILIAIDLTILIPLIHYIKQTKQENNIWKRLSKWYIAIPLMIILVHLFFWLINHNLSPKNGAIFTGIIIISFLIFKLIKKYF